MYIKSNWIHIYLSDAKLIKIDTNLQKIPIWLVIFSNNWINLQTYSTFSYFRRQYKCTYNWINISFIRSSLLVTVLPISRMGSKSNTFYMNELFIPNLNKKLLFLKKLTITDSTRKLHYKILSYIWSAHVLLIVQSHLFIQMITTFTNSAPTGKTCRITLFTYLSLRASDTRTNTSRNICMKIQMSSHDESRLQRL